METHYKEKTIKTLATGHPPMGGFIIRKQPGKFILDSSALDAGSLPLGVSLAYRCALLETRNTSSKKCLQKVPYSAV